MLESLHAKNGAAHRWQAGMPRAAANLIPALH